MVYIKMPSLNESILSVGELRTQQEEAKALLLYFSHDSCNVCRVLKPRITELIGDKFPMMEMAYVDIKKIPEATGYYSVFTVPTLLVIFEGRETLRLSRHFSMRQLEDSIARPYALMFGSQG